MKNSYLKHITQVLFVCALFIIISWNRLSSYNNVSSNAAAAVSKNVTHAEAIITGTKADTIVEGNATFDMDNGKVKMMLVLTIPKLANKTVAVHLHEHPDCADNGMATHGHWNPTHMPHGKWGSDSFHLGDIGNVMLDAQGNGSMEMTTSLWTLGADSNSVLNKAVIVHSGADDYTTQPSGKSGSRIGCGVIK